MIPKFLCTCFLLTAVHLLALSQSAGITDGPYVFYHQGQVHIESVSPANEGYKAVRDIFPEGEASQHPLTVHLEGHPDWDFTVNLKKKITTASPVTNKNKKATVLVLSDIEGEFEPFRNLLLAAKVINTNYEWTFGKGKLIIAGDLFDRGKQVCQYLWLLYKLEDEAAKKGGEVHVILGNHDIMNLSGDFRYVQGEYNANAKLLGKEYAELYGPDTELGRWLRSKNIIENVNGLLVMHGGISSDVLNKKLSVKQLNSYCRPYYDKPQEIPDSLKTLFGSKCIFWYRGYFLDPLASTGLVDSTLDFYHAKKIIVGHDIIDHVALLYQGKIIGVDVNEHENSHEALLIRKRKYYKLDDKGIITVLTQ